MLDHYGHVEPDSERFELWNDTLLGRIIFTTAAFLVNQQQIVIQVCELTGHDQTHDHQIPRWVGFDDLIHVPIRDGWCRTCSHIYSFCLVDHKVLKISTSCV